MAMNSSRRRTSRNAGAGLPASDTSAKRWHPCAAGDETRRQHPAAPGRVTAHDEQRTVDISLRYRKHLLTNLPRCERIRRNPTRWRINRLTGAQRAMKGRRFGRLDGYDLDVVLIPRSDTSDQSTTTDSYQ